MNEKPHFDHTNPEIRKGLRLEIGAKAKRKLKSKKNSSRGVWFGLGMMGLVGWAVVVPTLLGTALGIWLDNRHPGTHSWTLTLLVIGLVIGCLNAWHCVDKQDKEMIEEEVDNDVDD